MSLKGVVAVLSRAMLDEQFVEAIFANPEKVLAGFDLTMDELTQFKNMSRVDFEAFAKASPEERKSFGALQKII